MRWYAERPERAARQVLADLFVLTWTIAWIWFASEAFDLVSQMAVPGRKLESGGTSLAGSLADAGQRAGDVPLIGGALSAPLDAASQASATVAGAGQSMQDAVRNMAWLLAILIVLIMVGSVLLVWLPLRVRYLRQASAAAKVRDANPDTDLFALRALVNQPLSTLVRVDPDPAAAWRSGDQPVIAKLADLELRRWGLRGRAEQPALPG
ncbi:MAG TPA: hypothetical protein VKG85_04000 [Actinomycetes bacterium]|nr:hypothetical protein [Actinomycetes bacterium]